MLMANGLEGSRTPVRNTLLDSSTCLVPLSLYSAIRNGTNYRSQPSFQKLISEMLSERQLFYISQ